MTRGDIEAAAGFSNNPFSAIDSRSSAYGRLSLFALHSVRSQTGSTTLNGYIENTSYLRGHYGSKQNYAVSASTNQQVSPTATIYGSLNFSGDFAGQLSNRLIDVPPTPPVFDPGDPLLPPDYIPDAFGYSGRQYRLRGQVGTSIRTNARSTVSASLDAERVMFGGDIRPPSYNIFSGSLAYSRQISERTRLGGAVYAQQQDYSGDNGANIINPTATINMLLSENLTLDGGAGILFIHNRAGDTSESSTAASFSLKLCKEGQSSSWCGQIARDARNRLGSSTGIQGGQPTISTIESLSYFHRLDAVSTIQASIRAVQYSTVASVVEDHSRRSYLSGVIGYNRNIGRRLSTGISAGLRKVFQPGTDPNYDVNGSIYLRYRWGQVS